MTSYFVDTWYLVARLDRAGIHHVLTNDHHFALAGFTLVNQ
jgi:hypothetical protein